MSIFLRHVGTIGGEPRQSRPAPLERGDTAKTIASVLTRPNETGRVEWSHGNQAVVQFADGKRYHYWRHELEHAE